MEKTLNILKRNSKLIIIVLILIYMYFSVKKKYNSMVKMQESSIGQWSNVSNEYQRRLDLIPNLVNTVKGYANFEKETLQSVIEARAKATSVNIDPSNITESDLKRFQEVQKGVQSSLSRLMVTVEKYPDLKANQNFLALQNQLEETENRINFQRKLFNDLIKSYNTYIRQFPNNLYSGIFGFDKKAYFESEQGAQNAPKIDFSN